VLVAGPASFSHAASADLLGDAAVAQFKAFGTRNRQETVPSLPAAGAAGCRCNIAKAFIRDFNS